MDAIIAQALHLRLWRYLDVQFARLLAGDGEPALLLACACLSADAGAGHVCLPLERLRPDRLFDGRHPELAGHAWRLAGALDAAGWRGLLSASPAVSDGARPTPLVLDNGRLYLQRMWQNECRVAAFFRNIRPAALADEQRVKDVLDRFFSTGGSEPDWQKVAAAVAISHPVSLISGGPGTGKTTTVARLLASMMALAEGRYPRIRLAAPTGKAAARLSESLGAALAHLDLSPEQKRQFPTEAVTLHRLLGVQPNSQRLRHHAGNPLHVDILVVDEASMIDLPMMANLIAALPSGARVIFLGDRCQLASVEAGAVLGDICFFAEQGYSPARRDQLARLTGCPLLPGGALAGRAAGDSLCLLRKSYRFDELSGIGRLAAAVNAGDSAGALALLHDGRNADLYYAAVRDGNDYRHMLDGVVAGYGEFLSRVKARADPAEILSAFGDYRLLCALREGPFGVAGLNPRIEQALALAGLLPRQAVDGGRAYAGRPVMIVRNAPSLGLYNGDIGIMLGNEHGELRAVFPMPDGLLKSVPLSRLPEHETAFAMTVHKSQGSEFGHTALVLPSQVLPVLSRELVYTAITRARRRLSLYANDPVLRHAIVTPTQRRSGLIDRMGETAG
ncbi:exodeoxyribonuclease V subunit alpha [Martelella alba]|uniref:RecBCD enzyme subunit RecD n=1 Tax=Martelella alba TaxID=2590451 RepID=A0ABY2SM08_9HYPH|nr:exodeoxyribonuclease V subunit alpha [Martelella alba]TKI05925.1 exodeoxyribonuclease V subunit alpha [Martelella alba]